MAPTVVAARIVETPGLVGRTRRPLPSMARLAAHAVGLAARVAICQIGLPAGAPVGAFWHYLCALLAISFRPPTRRSPTCRPAPSPARAVSGPSPPGREWGECVLAQGEGR